MPLLCCAKHPATADVAINPMSAFGTKRTSHRIQPMSAFGGKADINGRHLPSKWFAQIQWSKVIL
jgi:hypothetical protein